MFKSEKGFLSLITILLFLILIGVFAWGIIYFRQQPISQELPRQLQLPSPVVSPTPGPFQVYTNSKLGFSFQYPQDWMLKEVASQSAVALYEVAELHPKTYSGPLIPIKLLTMDNPAKLSLADLDKKLITKKGQSILYSVDDIYTLTGIGLTVNLRNDGDCDGKKCQIYTFSRDKNVYQLQSYLDANIFNQRQVFDQIINSFKFNDFASTSTLGASTSAIPAHPKSVVSPH